MEKKSNFNRYVIVFCATILISSSIFAISYFSDDSNKLKEALNDRVNPILKINCLENYEPQSYEENGLYFTQATPNYQRPCGMPVLFGGTK